MLAAICAVQQLPRLRRYVGAALNLELPREAPFEIFLQIGIYSGFAAAESAIEAAAALYKGARRRPPQRPPRNDPLKLLTQRRREVTVRNAQSAPTVPINFNHRGET